MPALAPFTPSSAAAGSIAITVAGTSAAVALPTTQGDQVKISSLAANAVAFFVFGTNTTVAVIPAPSGNGVPILPGTTMTLTVPTTATFIATIGTAGNTLYLTRGDGQ